MRIVNVAQSNLCNIGTNLSRGLRRLGHDARSLVLRPAPYDMDTDLMWSRDTEMCRQVLEGAEALHLNSLAAGFTLWLQRPPFDLARVCRGRRIVVQYHGGDLRRTTHPSVKALIARHRLPAVVTVPDLLPDLPGAAWLPIPVDPNDPLYAPGSPPTSPIRICHAPSTRAIKKTDAFLAATDRLRERYDIDVVLIENKPFAECLAVKRTCHINFDNVGFGSYAAASIESLLMEQPSLVYLNESSVAAVRGASTEVGIESPLVQVGDERQPTHEQLNAILEGTAKPTYSEGDVASIADALEPLIADDGYRREIGRRGRRWAAAVHGDRRIAAIAARLYEETPTLDGFHGAERLEQLFSWGAVTARNMMKEKRKR